MLKAPLPANETQRIATLRELEILDTPAEERFDRITRVAVDLFNVPIALISLVDSDRQWFKSCQGLSVQETPREISFCGHAILETDIMYVPDTQTDPRFADNPLVTAEPGIRFYAGYPLSGPDGNKVGTFCIADHRSRTLDERQMQLLRDLAAWAYLELTAVVVLQKELAKQTAQAIRQERTFFKLMESLPVGVFVLDAAGNAYYANQTAQQLLGKGIAPGSDAQHLAEVYGAYIAGTDQEYPARKMPIIRALSGQSTEVEDIEIHRPDGILNIEVWATPVFDEHGVITHAIAAFQDITARRRSERRLATYYAVTSILSDATELIEATPRILQAICKQLGWHVGAIWAIDGTTNLIRCVDLWHQPSLEATEFEALTRKFTFPPGVGLPGRVWANHEPVWISNIVEDSNFPRTPAALKNGLHAALAFPICFQKDVIAVMEFFHRQIQKPDDETLLMFQALGDQIGQFMGRKQAELALQDAHRKYPDLALDR